MRSIVLYAVMAWPARPIAATSPATTRTQAQPGGRGATARSSASSSRSIASMAAASDGEGVPAPWADPSNARKRQVIRQHQRSFTACTLDERSARLARQRRQRVEDRRPFGMLDLQRMVDQVADIDRKSV